MEFIKVLLTLIVLVILGHFIFEFVGWIAKKTPLDMGDMRNAEAGGFIVLLTLFICVFVYTLVFCAKAIISWIITQWKDS
jgi:hypothetical protein